VRAEFPPTKPSSLRPNGSKVRSGLRLEGLFKAAELVYVRQVATRSVWWMSIC